MSREHIEDAKAGFLLLHDRKKLAECTYSELEIETGYYHLLSRLSKDEKIEFNKWKEFQKRIIKNDFPELSQ